MRVFANIGFPFVICGMLSFTIGYRLSLIFCGIMIIAVLILIVKPEFRRTQIMLTALTCALSFCFFGIYNMIDNISSLDKNSAEIKAVVADRVKTGKGYEYTLHTYDIDADVLGNKTVIMRDDEYIEKYKLIKTEVEFTVYKNNIYADRCSDIAVSGDDYSVMSFAGRVKDHVTATLKPYFSKKGYASFCGILLGDKSGISEDDYQSFIASGLVHAFSVSGMHIVIITNFIMLLLGRFVKSQRKKHAAAALFVIMFACLTDLSAPVLRSVIMAGAASFGAVINRRSDGLNSIGLAAFIIALSDPLSVVSVSFMLTFAASAALIVAAPYFKYVSDGINSKIVLSVCEYVYISFCAYAATTPIAFLFFGEISIISPVVNLLTAPLMSLVLPLSFIAMLLSFIPGIDFVINCVCFVCDKIFCLIFDICKSASQLPFAYFNINK